MEEDIKTQVEKIKDLSDEILNSDSKPETEQNEIVDVNSADNNSKPSKPFTQWPIFGWFLNSKSAGGLVGKIVLLLAIPYAYLFILSAIFDTAKVYSAAPFILYSSIVFWLVNIMLAVWAIVRFCKKG